MMPEADENQCFYCCTGLHTTPQLHWMLRRLNRGQPGSERDYYASLAAAFQQLVHGCPAPPQQVHWLGSCMSLCKVQCIDCASTVHRLCIDSGTLWRSEHTQLGGDSPTEAGRP
jgi:hypothetical protein